MIDLEKAVKEFLIYTNNYDLTNPKIELKKHHSLRVMECSKEIAQSIDLNEEHINLATLIGLLHDIARFEQMKRYNTFFDPISIDHGDLAVDILEENNFIRKFAKDDKYDEIIKVAIKNHNKWQIQDGLEGEDLLYSQIIRDADKIDIFWEGKELFWKQASEIEAIEKSNISDDVYEKFLNHLPIKREKHHTPADRIVLFMAFIFDLNFKYSFKTILENNYINIILDRFDFKNPETKAQFLNIRKKSIEYLKNNS